MDVKFINHFLNGSLNVLKTMAFVEPKAGELFLKRDSIAVGDVSGSQHKISHALGGLSILIPFKMDEGPFVVDVCLKV